VGSDIGNHVVISGENVSTRKEIDEKWKPLHDKLTSLYYVEKKVDKQTFDRLHAAVWLLHEKESIEALILPDFAVDEAGKLRSAEINELIVSLGGEETLRSLISKI